MDKVKQWMYYVIIGVISLIALCFLPMIGSDIGLGWNVPNTTVGWIVWISVKCIVATLNVLIFHCFMCQAKLNIRDNKSYKDAQQLLLTVKQKDYVPRSPKEWTEKQYTNKGVVIFITTALSTIALTQALLQFDYVTMLTYLFTIVMGLIFGVMQMKSAEDYWTNEFYDYAKLVQKEMEMAKNTPVEQKNDTSNNNGRVDILEPSDNFDPISLNYKPVVVDNNFSDYCFLGSSINTSNSSSGSVNSVPCKTI